MFSGIRRIGFLFNSDAKIKTFCFGCIAFCVNLC